MPEVVEHEGNAKLPVLTEKELGHEPFPLTRGKIYYVFGPDAYCLPNVISYARRIAEKKGWRGVYRGVGLSFIYGLSRDLGINLGYIFLDRHRPDLKHVRKLDKYDHHGAIHQTVRHKFRESLARTAGAVLGSPLRVVMVRRIASIIGGETEYDTLIGSFQHIYQTEGVAGFFKGLVPYVIAEWGTIWLMGALSLAVDRGFVVAFDADPGSGDLEDLEEEPADAEEAKSKISTLTEDMEGVNGLRKMAKFGIPFVVASYVYHYSVLSTIMTVNNVGLAAGLMPYAPPFDNWQQGLVHLKAVKGFKRGAKLFFRHYVGPVTYRLGHVYASL